MLPFSDTSGNTGLAQQTLSFMGVDSTQWPLYKIANSYNNYLDKVNGYAIGADRKFQWDNTNHTKLPEGTTSLNVSQSDYSFLQDEQGNPIITLLGVSILNGGYYRPLIPVDRSDPGYDPATFGFIAGTPSKYDKIADNIARLDSLPPATIASGLKFYFQRVSPDFTAASTTQTTGCSPLLDRGFIIQAAYDGALSLGLPALQGLLVEQAKEEQKMIEYFTNRNNDTVPFIHGVRRSAR